MNKTSICVLSYMKPILISGLHQVVNSALIFSMKTLRAFSERDQIESRYISIPTEISLASYRAQQLSRHTYSHAIWSENSSLNSRRRVSSIGGLGALFCGKRNPAVRRARVNKRAHLSARANFASECARIERARSQSKIVDKGWRSARTREARSAARVCSRRVGRAILKLPPRCP